MRVGVPGLKDAAVEERMGCEGEGGRSAVGVACQDASSMDEGSAVICKWRQ